MNELIRSLAKKSDPGYTGKDDGNMGHALVGDEAIQKFAELLVKECCDLLINQGEMWLEFSKNPPPDQEKDATPALFTAFRLKEDAVWNIQEHFDFYTDDDIDPDSDETMIITL